ncbi:MAG: LON peptidase substrate-binding domain-containing protein [Ilumatobacteraceae bacterium]
MPMFPLGTVLLPGGVLPLHVFEPRYRQLVVDLLANDVDDPEFGVTMIERGREVGGGDDRAAVGVIGRVVQIEALDDGRYALLAVGTHRFRVNAWLPDDPYPLADIDVWPDNDVDEPGLGELIAGARARIRDVQMRVAKLGEAPAAARADDVEPEISDDPLLATYHLAGIAPLGPADRYRLLCADSPRQRLELLDTALDDVVAMIEFRRT